MEKLQLDDFTKYKFLSGVKISPNGENTGFVVHEMDLDNNKYLSNIHIYKEKDQSSFQLTSFDQEKGFIWSTKDTILFPGIRNEEDKKRKENGEEFTPFYEISINGGEAKKSFEIPLNVNQIELVDENTFLLTGSFDLNRIHMDDLSSEEKEEIKKKKEEEKNYEIIDEIPFWSNGVGFTNKKRNRLYSYNLEKKTLTPITDEFTNVRSFKLNKSKDQVVIVATSYMDKMQDKTDLHLYSIQKNTINKISHKRNFKYSYGDFINKKIIFAGNEGKDFGLNENPSFYTMDLNKNNYVEKISHDDFDSSILNSVGSDCRYGSGQSMVVDKDYLYFVSTNGYNSYINRINDKGNIDRLTRSNGSIDDFHVLEGKIKFVGLRGLKLQELYNLEMPNEVQITSFNDWVIDEKSLSEPEYISMITEDINIEGWIMKPVGFKKGEKYPGILNIHGGPKTVYGNVFFHEMQYWANEGYVVFFCNPRGGDGKGNEFADIRGKYGTIDYDDLMNFTDMVLKEYPFVDRERLGVTGGSYGGFMTNWIIGHTNRFKAAASQRSISNWISFFGTTDIGYFFAADQNAATPWSDFEKLWAHSPMKYADKVVTPTLFIHSEEDYRCWIPEGLQMFTSLKYHGVDARLVMFKGENHELSRSGKPKHRIKRLKEITDWFDKYLK